VQGCSNIWEIWHRIACLRAYFDFKGGALCLSTLHQELDPTEKSNANYQLGMTLAGLWSETHNYPWTVHFSRVKKMKAVNFTTVSRKEPDLLGLRIAAVNENIGQHSDWLICEAKSRQRVHVKLKNQILQQKSAISSINGYRPSLAIGCISKTSGGSVSLEVIDPEPLLEGMNYHIDIDRFILAYYEPILILLESDQNLLSIEINGGLLTALRELREYVSRNDLGDGEESVYAPTFWKYANEHEENPTGVSVFLRESRND
jgi:hypothetical protein